MVIEQVDSWPRVFLSELAIVCSINLGLVISPPTSLETFLSADYPSDASTSLRPLHATPGSGPQSATTTMVVDCRHQLLKELLASSPGYKREMRTAPPGPWFN